MTVPLPVVKPTPAPPPPPEPPPETPIVLDWSLLCEGPEEIMDVYPGQEQLVP